MTISRITTAASFVAAWLGVGLGYGALYDLFYTRLTTFAAWIGGIADGLTIGAIWLTAYVMARRFPLYSRHPVRNLVLAGFVAVVVITLRVVFFYWSLGPLGWFDEPLGTTLVTVIPTGMLSTILLWSGPYSVPFFQEMRKTELQSARVARDVEHARLQALVYQLQPHFVCNSLNGVSALLHEDAPAARQMLRRLRELIERILSVSDEPTVPLEKELQLAREYIALEEIRFSDRLTTKFIAPASLNSVPVPTLILQPLIENAVKHNVSNSFGPVEIVVECEATHGHLRVSVQSTAGLYWNERQSEAKGVGISNTRERLKRFYGEDARLILSLGEDTTVATLMIPIDRNFSWR